MFSPSLRSAPAVKNIHGQEMETELLGQHNANE